MSSNSSVENQTWRNIQSVSYRIQQEQVQQRLDARNQALLGHVGKKQQMEKDVLVPAALVGEGATSLKGRPTESQEVNKPTIPLPSRAPGEDGDNYLGKDEGLIAIIGAVLALQAKCNSNFWSTLWQQTSESMMQQVKMAPIIAQATENAAADQADATRQQAKQEEIDGWINIGMFGLAVGMGAFLEIQNPTKDIAKNNVDFEAEDKPPTEDPEASTNLNSGTSEAQNQRVLQNVNDAIQKESDSFSTKALRAFKNLFNKSKLQSGFTGFLLQLNTATQTMSLAAQGSTSLVNQHYLSMQANDQQAQGVEEALSKETEQYAQFYGQDFSRGTDLAQGSAQNIDWIMNILKSASDTITQTVNSMFRG